jgi:hypothetical protein
MVYYLALPGYIVVEFPIFHDVSPQDSGTYLATFLLSNFKVSEVLSLYMFYCASVFGEIKDTS